MKAACDAKNANSADALGSDGFFFRQNEKRGPSELVVVVRPNRFLCAASKSKGMVTYKNYFFKFIFLFFKIQIKTGCRQHTMVLYHVHKVPNVPKRSTRQK